MDLGPSNASRMDHFKSSGRVPHERRYLHTLRPYILTSMIEIVMIHVRIFIFLLHSFHERRRLRLLHVHEQHARLLQLLISSEQVQSRNRALCLFTPLLAILASERRSAAPYSRDLQAKAV